MLVLRSIPRHIKSWGRGADVFSSLPQWLQYAAKVEYNYFRHRNSYQWTSILEVVWYTPLSSLLLYISSPFALASQRKDSNLQLPYWFFPFTRECDCCRGGQERKLITTGMNSKHVQQVHSWQRLSSSWASQNISKEATDAWLALVTLPAHSKRLLGGASPQCRPSHRGGCCSFPAEGKPKCRAVSECSPCSKWPSAIWDPVSNSWLKFQPSSQTKRILSSNLAYLNCGCF